MRDPPTRSSSWRRTKLHPGGRRAHGRSARDRRGRVERRYVLISSSTAIDPSPAAEAMRLIEPERTSPTASALGRGHRCAAWTGPGTPSPWPGWSAYGRRRCACAAGRRRRSRRVVRAPRFRPATHTSPARPLARCRRGSSGAPTMAGSARSLERRSRRARSSADRSRAAPARRGTR